MNNRFREDMNELLSGVIWEEEDARRVMKAIRGEKTARRHRPLLLAAVLALLAALACAAYAELGSELLSWLFHGGKVNQSAEELLTMPIVSVAHGGVTARVTECLYDGQALYLAGSMTNESDAPLLCGLMTPGNWGEGIFYGSCLNWLEPGQTRKGQAQIELTGFDEDFLEQIEEGFPVLALAVRPRGTPEHNDQYRPELYETDRFYGTEQGETMMEEILYVPMEEYVRQRLPATVPLVSEFRMDGYTVVVDKANFAAASVRIRFTVIPDDNTDILAYGDEGEDGHGRLYRWYRIFCPDANGGRFELKASGDYGWKENRTRLVYNFTCGALPETPQVFWLVPVGDDDALIAEEEIEVRLARTKE